MQMVSNGQLNVANVDKTPEVRNQLAKKKDPTTTKKNAALERNPD